MKTTILHLVALFLIFSGSRAEAQELVQITDPSGADSLFMADTTRLITVKEIVIQGNRRTRERAILRELTFHLNNRYTITSLAERFNDSRRFLINTGLFYNVVISLGGVQGTDATVLINVKERWLIDAAPIFKVINESKVDVRRVNYGLKITNRNVTGRNDKLHLYLLAGFNYQAAVRYEGLYLDKSFKWSASLGASLSKTHSLNYATANNRALEYRDNNRFVQSYFRPEADIVYRPAYTTRHIFSAKYHIEKVADTITNLNPLYANGRRSFHYPELGYTLAYTNVDFLPYPLKGYMGQVSLTRKGFGSAFNLWQFAAKASFSRPLSEKYFFNLCAAGVIKMPFKQPYIMQPILGNNMNLQGFEDYVLDGVAGAYTKAVFLRQLINTAVQIPSKKIKRLNHIPLRVYGKVFGNTGYIYHPEAKSNRLNNEMLYSGGVGIDIVMLTDFVLKLEWSFNQLGVNGLSLRQRSYY